MKEEFFDVLNENGELTGEKCSRSDAHREGIWHKTVHIYLFRKVNETLEFLVHLRSKFKDLHPNEWDTRFGGHLQSGESEEYAVSEELKEEIGLNVKETELIKGLVYKRDHFPNREFTTVYYYNFNGGGSSLKFNDGEVQEVKWMEAKKIIELIEKDQNYWSSNVGEFTDILNFLKTKI